MSYAHQPKPPAPTPKEFPKALKNETEFLDSLISDDNDEPRNLPVINIHEDRWWGWIAPQKHGLVSRTEYCAAFGWLKLVEVVADEKPAKRSKA